MRAAVKTINIFVKTRRQQQSFPTDHNDEKDQEGNLATVSGAFSVLKKGLEDDETLEV